MDFRIRQRHINMTDRYNRRKMSQIRSIEVADTYWDKDFWGWVSWKFTSNGIKSEWYKKHTEAEYLSFQLWMFKEHYLYRLEKVSSSDAKFLREDLDWVLRTKFPKNEEIKQLRDCFFSCRRILQKHWKEYYFWEKMRWMYEDEFNEYCREMEMLQENLIKEMQ